MYILDTNVVSELRKAGSGRADSRVISWAEDVHTTDLYLSVITLQELELGVLLVERKDAAQGMVLRTWLNSHVLPAFTERIIAIDVAIAIYAAKLHVPDPRPVRDGLIAATALVHGMTVVTRNIKDFAPTGVSLLNPWTWAL
ncbi:MAG: type II toxin-antitoxin system VapC family toxin [Desulfovermiculus sp.]